jgi:Mg-chelatase subunit ChlD
VPVWPLGEPRPRDMASTVYRQQPRGGTALAPAILEATRLLSDTPATRHVMLVVTDGECFYGSGLVREACTLAADAGIEVVGLGVKAAQVIAQAFPDGRSVNVDDAIQLGRRGMRQVADVLDDGAGH